MTKSVTLSQRVPYTRAADGTFDVLPGTYPVVQREYFPGRPFEAIVARCAPPGAAPWPASAVDPITGGEIFEIEIPVRRLRGACIATMR
jgi:hypothetical protein